MVWWAWDADECKFPISSAPGVAKLSMNMHHSFYYSHFLYEIFIKDGFFHDDFREQIIFCLTPKEVHVFVFVDGG